MCIYIYILCLVVPQYPFLCTLIEWWNSQMIAHCSSFFSVNTLLYQHVISLSLRGSTSNRYHTLNKYVCIPRPSKYLLKLFWPHKFNILTLFWGTYLYKSRCVIVCMRHIQNNSLLRSLIPWLVRRQLPWMT